jgi:hypothetical protein
MAACRVPVSKGIHNVLEVKKADYDLLRNSLVEGEHI